MRVIGLAVVLAVGLLAALATEAQRTEKVARIGVLVTLPRSAATGTHPYAAFLKELRDLGYVEGQNVTIEWRHTDGNPERRRREAAALVAWKPDVVLATGGSEARVLHDVDPSVLIVVAANSSDMVDTGLVQSLARPRGNVTGLQILQADLSPKRLEILKEWMPWLQRVAVIYEKPSTEGSKLFTEKLLTDLAAAAKRLSVRIARFEVTSEQGIDRAFTDMKRSFQAMIVIASPVLTTHRPRIVDLAARHRLPAMYEYRIWVESGGLVSYGVKISDHYRRAAQFVDRILKGAKPADIPVEQPAVFELVINEKDSQGTSRLLRSDWLI